MIPVTTRQNSARHPDIVISHADMEHLEALADGAMQRNPALADRLLDELGRARIVQVSDMPAHVVAIAVPSPIVTRRQAASGRCRSCTPRTRTSPEGGSR